MVLFAAAILAASPVQSPAAPTAVTSDRQAQAMVRILPAAALRFAELDRARPEMFRESQIRSADGSATAVRLVEFE